VSRFPRDVRIDFGASLGRRGAGRGSRPLQGDVRIHFGRRQERVRTHCGRRK
jgi:hypothetical protein